MTLSQPVWCNNWQNKNNTELTASLTLQSQTAMTHPFLAIVILQIIDSLGVPLLTDAKEDGRQEPVLSHDDKVYKESSQSLDHTNLTIGHGDEPVPRERSRLIQEKMLDQSHRWVSCCNICLFKDLYCSLLYSSVIVLFILLFCYTTIENTPSKHYKYFLLEVTQ